MRASMVTRPALDRVRPGIIDCESSRVNSTGQLPTRVRYTASGMPGDSIDLATMNSVSPAAALPLNAASSVTSPLTEAPVAAVALASSLSVGSCCARALAASAGRPRNSNDFASSSQSPGLPPPLASRASKLAIALSMDPALDFVAGVAGSADCVIGQFAPVALLNTLAAAPNELAVPAAVMPAGGADAVSGFGCPNPAYSPKIAITRITALADVRHGVA